MPVSSLSVPQGLEKQSNSQADEWNSFHGTADGFRWIHESFRSLPGTRVTPQCSLSHLGHSTDTPALLETPHGQTPPLPWIQCGCCAFSASLLQIPHVPVQAFPGLPCSTGGSCSLSSRLPDGTNTLDSSAPWQVPWEDAHN